MSLNEKMYCFTIDDYNDYIGNSSDVKFTQINMLSYILKKHPNRNYNYANLSYNPNISWVTQIKQPESIKPPTIPSLIRVDANATTQNALSTGSSK